MRIYPECIPCFFQQGLLSLQLATDDRKIHFEGLKEIVNLMPELLKLDTPTHVGRVIHSLPKKLTGNPDPYKQVKAEHIKIASRLYPELKRLVREAEDPLFAGLKVAVAGNIIDFGRGRKFNLEKEIKHELNSCIQMDFVQRDYEEFKKELDKVDKILYLADNAGETVFDKVFIEELGKKVLYAVRGSPVLNDAGVEEALESGIDEVASIINSGTDAPGVLLEYCTSEFRKLFSEAELIISKGQGNHEGLAEVSAPIYFLFKVKCHAVADYLKVNVGDIVFVRQRL